MKVLAKVSYLGTNFHGWQKQPNARSVQEEIEKVLSKILSTPTDIYGSGRTDAGVHAKGQTFHFVINKEVDLNKLFYSVNMLLPKDIHIVTFKEVDEDFHARFSVKQKHYQYVINIKEEDPFTTDLTYFFPYNINLDLLKECSNKFVGKHNYQDFTSKEEDEDNYVRTIYSINVSSKDNYIYIDFIGDGFMRYMIRDIVGTLLAISTGKEDISFIDKHLDSNNRNIISYKAPSNGLYLIDVIY